MNRMPVSPAKRTRAAKIAVLAAQIKRVETVGALRLTTRRIALSRTASLGLCALVLGMGIAVGAKVARAQASQTVTTGYYNASTGTSFIVPAGVTSLQIEAWGGGGAGGLGTVGTGGAGGGGGFAGGTFSVTANQVLTLLVGGGGSDGTGGTGGANGGGTVYYGGSGGGYSAVYSGTTLITANLLVVAGGGGGGGGLAYFAAAGAVSGAGSAGGSGAAGSNGSVGGTGGGAGTTTAAGAGGTGNYANGGAGSGMTGGSHASFSRSFGGGGGGGYFGGGQGGDFTSGSVETTGGGGGGSSFVLASASSQTLTGGSGMSAGNNGSADYRSGVGVGTAGTSNNAFAATGGSGEVFFRYTAAITSFDFTGSGLSGSTSAPVTGSFSNGFYYTLTTGSTVAPLTFGGSGTTTAYTATDNLTNAVTTTGLTFTNTGSVTLLRGASGTSNLLTLVTNTGTSAAPTIALNNSAAVTVNLDLALNATTTVSGTGSATLGGVLSGAGGLTRTGAGTLTLTGANTYTGGTTVSAGTLQLGDGSTSNGSIAGNISNNASLIIANPNAQTYNGVVSGSGAMIKTGAGTLTLTGTNTFTGGLSVTSGRVVESNNGSALSTGTVAIGSGAIVELANTTGNLIVQGPTTFTGTGTLQKTGASQTAFGNNGNVNIALSAGGLIDIQAGTVNGSSSFQGIYTNNKGSLNIASGATFNGVEGIIIVDALTGAGTLSGGYFGSGSTTIGVSGGSGTFSGVIRDNGAGSTLALTKTGAGTETLTGANTYTGGTKLNAGTVVAGGSALGTGAVTIASGATLAVGEAPDAAFNAITTHALSVSSLAVTTGSTTPLLTFNLGASGTSDTLNLTGSGNELTFSGSGTFDISFASATGASLGAGTYDLLNFATPESLTSAPLITQYVASATGNLADVKGGASGMGTFLYTLSGGNITGLTYTITGADTTPEPSAVLLLALGSTGASIRALTAGTGVRLTRRRHKAA